MSAANISSHDEFDPAAKGLRVPAKCDSCKHRFATNLGFVAPDEGTTVRLIGTEFVCPLCRSTATAIADHFRVSPSSGLEIFSGPVLSPEDLKQFQKILRHAIRRNISTDELADQAEKINPVLRQVVRKTGGSRFGRGVLLAVLLLLSTEGSAVAVEVDERADQPPEDMFEPGIMLVVDRRPVLDRRYTDEAARIPALCNERGCSRVFKSRFTVDDSFGADREQRSAGACPRCGGGDTRTISPVFDSTLNACAERLFDGYDDEELERARKIILKANRVRDFSAAIDELKRESPGFIEVWTKALTNDPVVLANTLLAVVTMISIVLGWRRRAPQSMNIDYSKRSLIDRSVNNHYTIVVPGPAHGVDHQD